jgi:hypothetical protein
MLLLGGAESMPKGIPRQGHVAIGAPEGDKRRPIIRAERACSRVKQSHDLDFFTAKPTSPLPPLPGCQFFMKFRGPAAHPNRVENPPPNTGNTRSTAPLPTVPTARRRSNGFSCTSVGRRPMRDSLASCGRLGVPSGPGQPPAAGCHPASHSGKPQRVGAVLRGRVGRIQRRQAD